MRSTSTAARSAVSLLVHKSGPRHSLIERMSSSVCYCAPALATGDLRFWPPLANPSFLLFGLSWPNATLVLFLFTLRFPSHGAFLFLSTPR